MDIRLVLMRLLESHLFSVLSVEFTLEASGKNGFTARNDRPDSRVSFGATRFQYCAF